MNKIIFINSHSVSKVLHYDIVVSQITKTYGAIEEVTDT